GPARFRYPPLSTRTPSEAWSAANPTAPLHPSGSSGSRPAWDADDGDGPTHVDYAPARRMAQQIAPVFLIFPLSAPIDAITLLYTARRLGKRLRAIVEE
ncbi:hypothetical protein FRC00_007958, partial [Tulasnella sp. 408]